MSTTLRRLKVEDILLLEDKPSFLNFNALAPYFEKLLERQNKGEIIFLVARHQEIIAGFLYIQWQSEYPPFIKARIPDIKDLRVLPQYRRKGIATALMNEAEKIVFKDYPIIGLGVGLYADYGPAQQMYIKRGYVLDGRGLVYKEQPVKPGTHAFVDDDLLLYLIKPRNY
jgi:GNAT superfamily N-acetyltransferase